jgi:hypothetical protein
VLGAGRAAAQSQESYYAGPRPPASPIESTATPAPDSPPPTSSATSEAAAGPLTVRGTVLDSATHQGLPGVTVLLKGTNTGVSTDANGSFVLPVPANAAPVQLTFSFIGFTRQERTFLPTGSQPLVVILAPDGHILMGEVVITNFRQPWPWHPRRFFNWSKYWVTKPFRG